MIQQPAQSTAGNTGLWISLFISAIIPVILGFVLVESLPHWHWVYYPFHAMLESIGSLSALIIASLMIVQLQKGYLDRHYIWVACALISMGLLDGFHAVLHAGVSFVWLHSIATMAGGILFAAVWLPEAWITERRQRLLLFAVTIISLLAGIAAIALPELLPEMTVEEEFSLLARVINIAGGIGFLVGTAYFINDYWLAKKRQFSERQRTEDMVFANHCLLFGIAALLFETSSLWDAGWWWWHVLRFTAYFIVLAYFFVLFKRGQEQIEISEQRFRLITSRVPGIVYQFMIDTNGHRSLSYVSPTVERYLGLTAKTVMDDFEKWIELTHPDDLPGLEESIARSMNEMAVWEWEGRFIRPDGKLYWLHGSSTPTRLENGSIIWDGVFIDITERKRSEEKLSNEKDKAQDYLDIANVMLLAINNEGEITLVNRKGCEILGGEEAEITGKNWFDNFIPERSRQEIKTMFNSVMCGEIELPESYENLVVVTGGEERLIEWHNIVLYDDQGRITGTLSSAEDVTERRQAEIALLESEARLNEAQKLARIGSWDLNLLDKTLIWSDEIFRIFEIDKSNFDASYEAFLDAVHPDDRDRVDRAYSDSLVDRKPYEIVHRLQMAGGRIKHVRETCESFFDGDRPVRSLGTVQDITDMINAETELARYRDHLEELVEERTRELHNAQDELVRKERLATLGQLTATVSHELRNPLGAMRPSLFILNKCCDKSNDRTCNALNIIDRNISRCDHIIDELLDFTRITDLERQATQIDQWLESVIAEQSIPDDIQLNKDFSLGELELNVDTDRLQRAIINVIENACQAMLDDIQNGTHRPDSRLDVSSRLNGQRVEMIISDNGVGIADEIKEKIFEPLFSTKVFGVGLGMPTVRQIMQQHSGSIEIVSKEGEGTMVILWLPLE